MSSTFIRKANQEIALNEQQLLELAKIYKRPRGINRFVYYIEIQTADGPINFGKVIKDYQWDMLNLMMHEDRAILLASRQMSKCVTSDTMIIVKNDKTGEEMELTIEEFHILHKKGIK